MGLAAVCRLAIAATGLHWLATGNGLWAGVAAMALALTVIPVALIRDSQLRDATRAVVAILLAAHVALGMQGALYETSAVYDKWIHLLGSAALAGLGIAATLRYCDGHRVELPLTLLVLIVLAGTLSAGTLWELFEFSIDRTRLFTAQRGLDDTMLDLVADAIGACLVTVMYAASVSFRPRRTRSDGEPFRLTADTLDGVAPGQQYVTPEESPAALVDCSTPDYRPRQISVSSGVVQPTAQR